MTDEQFRALHQPLHVPAHFADAQTLTDKIAFAIADIGEANADAIIKFIEQEGPGATVKPLIAETHRLLAELYEQGLISAEEKNGELFYNLHKIIHANNGSVAPDLLAPGLD